MARRENDSPINRAISRLESAHQIKKEQNESAQNAANPAALLSSALPLMQLETIFKSSQKTFRGIAMKFENDLYGRPWVTLGKVAVGCFVAGMVIGHLGRSNSKGRS